jgi:predicted dehydrogenase
MRLALIGCGTVARREHLPAWRALGVDVVAFASGRRTSAAAAAQEWGTGDVHDDWASAVGRADVDAVDICTPNDLHAPVALAAAIAGKHVFVEKPMATDVTSADAMVSAARAAGIVLMPAHNVRFAPPFAAMRAAVAEGRIGAVTGARAAFGHSGPEHWAPDATWFRDVARAGGGALTDLGVHVIDTVRAVLADDVVAVSALVDRDPRLGAVEDDAQLLLRFARGAVASVHASWVARPGPDHQLTVFGTAGTLHLDGRTAPTLFPADGTAGVVLGMPAATTVYRAFVDAVAGGAPAVTAADGRAAVAVVAAAYESARSGSLVDVA